VSGAPPKSPSDGRAALRVSPFGDRAWLVEAVEAPRGWLLQVAARAAQSWPDSLVVPGLASLLIVRTVTWDGPGELPPRLVDPASRWPQTADVVRVGLAAPKAEARSGPARTHVLPARYDGPDLAAAAAQLGLDAAELVARHVRAEWTVAAVGFSPGFGYLTSPDPVFDGVTRRPDPRPPVPAGAIALQACARCTRRRPPGAGRS
jgi:allophanate hydrolase subunit 1